MKQEPNMEVLEDLRQTIGEHLANIATFIDPKYKLTLLARLPGDHGATIIVTDDTDLDDAANELITSDDLRTVDPFKIGKNES